MFQGLGYIDSVRGIIPCLPSDPNPTAMEGGNMSRLILQVIDFIPLKVAEECCLA